MVQWFEVRVESIHLDGVPVPHPRLGTLVL
jgi:hypothetical protein